MAYLAGNGAVVTFGDPTAEAATEVCVELPQAASPANGTEAMLADAFLQRFRAVGSDDVKKLLNE